MPEPKLSSAKAFIPSHPYLAGCVERAMDAALEAAAKVVDDYYDRCRPGEEIAAAIRKLKQEPKDA